MTKTESKELIDKLIVNGILQDPKYKDDFEYLFNELVRELFGTQPSYSNIDFSFLIYDTVLYDFKDDQENAKKFILNSLFIYTAVTAFFNKYNGVKQFNAFGCSETMFIFELNKNNWGDVGEYPKLTIHCDYAAGDAYNYQLIILGDKNIVDADSFLDIPVSLHLRPLGQFSPEAVETNIKITILNNYSTLRSLHRQLRSKI